VERWNEERAQPGVVTQGFWFSSVKSVQSVQSSYQIVMAGPSGRSRKTLGNEGFSRHVGNNDFGETIERMKRIGR
jgi:hypothetical protein